MPDEASCFLGFAISYLFNSLLDFFTLLVALGFAAAILMGGRPVDENFVVRTLAINLADRTEDTLGLACDVFTLTTRLLCDFELFRSLSSVFTSFFYF